MRKQSSLVAGLLLMWLAACSPQVTSSSSAPIENLPSTSCPSTLSINGAVLQIEPIQINSDGSLPELPNQPNVAYWIDGTDRIFMFILSATPENRALANSLLEGSLAETIWPGCVSIIFTLSAPQPGSFEVTYLPDQSTVGIQIFILPEASEDGLVINGTELEG